MPRSPDIAALLERPAREHPERAALAYGEGTVSFGELGPAADRLAAALGLAAGERVMVVAPNVPALAVGLFAAWRSGAVPVPLSARLRGFELRRVFADVEPVAAVCVAAHGGFDVAAEIDSLAWQTRTLCVRVVLDELGGVLHESRYGVRQQASPSPQDLAAILYTSGTTGEPRGALLPHAMADAMARNLAEALGEDAGAPYGMVVPASHAFGLGCLLCGLAAGGTAVLLDATSSLDPLVQALRAHHAPVLHGSPALFARVLRSGSELPMRAGFTAGSSCPPEILQTLDERGVRLLNLYGMTEIGAAACCRPDDSAETRYGTVGRPLDGYELRIAAEPAVLEGGGGDPQAPREIQVRSRYLPHGYHGRPWGDDELADGEWFRTGDLGELDASGNLVIAGRAKEVVNVGGFNVFPAEVESFLLTHPAIEQAVVVGVPHPVMGETLQAFVVAAPNTRLEPREVVRFAREGIAGYKLPYTVRVLDALPLLASGKPDRRALASEARKAGARAAEPAGMSR
ncbi:MAG: long-chain-fatty-acid--CoA ligase [Solirubrobacterales bacterium]|nr:long-chain-fatty-acid--CoA ligase [Solirubrobacterales bacterium]